MSGHVVVNGVPRDLAEAETLDAVVGTVSAAPSGIAVALNGDVVRRSLWGATVLRDGDRVEILTAVQGG